MQADILKEDQAQNTCIFSTEACVASHGSISSSSSVRREGAQLLLGVDLGYHIAEAGANPISQLAFTLANGFTFVEYYLSRG
ncbi:MAG: methylmalonyl-CoA mutase family protein [Polyangiales bacterium]